MFPYRRVGSEYVREAALTGLQAGGNIEKRPIEPSAPLGLDPDRDSKELGCPLNFRESASIGYRFMEHHSLSIMVDHMSNASLCSENEGMETFGLRYGYTF